MKKALLKILSLVSIIFFHLLAFIVTAALYLSTGYTNPLGLILTSLVGFSIVSIIRRIAWRRYVAGEQGYIGKKFIREFLLFSVLCQLFLILVFPIESIFPRWFLESAKIVHYVEEKECNIGDYLYSAKAFWGDQIDFSRVNVVEGGIMKNLYYLQKIGWIAKDNNYVREANVFGSTIYLADASSCEDKPTIFHELTHVWQIQNTVVFGPSQITGFIHTTYQQFYEPNVPYEYGGYAGLKKAKEEGKKFVDFGMEQQAMIIQHLIWFKDGFAFTEEEGGKVYAEAYKSILEEYANEMLSFKRS